jgi:hypothetical protein
MKPEVFRDLTHEAMAKANAACQAIQKVNDYLDALHAKGEKVPQRGASPTLDALMDAADTAMREMEDAAAKLRASP